MRYVTVLGAGLLVGTALAIIIPEGVHALYMNELETNQMQMQHEFHSDHKTVERHLNQINQGAKNVAVRDMKIDNDLKLDALPPAHQHTADWPRRLESELGHKTSDTVHSAIGINLLYKLMTQCHFI